MQLAAKAAAKPRRRSAPLVLSGVAFVWILLDQLTKYWAITSLQPGVHKQIAGEALQFVLVFNPGAAFSFLAGHTWVFTLLASCVVVVLAIQARKVTKYRWAVLIGLVLGGAAGNLIDRLFREPGFPAGHVVDFIYTPWMMPAVYNLADIGLVVAVVLIVLLLILQPSEKPALPEAPNE